MIHYHGLPINPQTAATKAIEHGHAFISFADKSPLRMAITICQSIAIDNGAFSAWRIGKPIKNWRKYYEFARECIRIPICDFAIIPDVINGTEEENNALLTEWPLPRWFGVPVWHMHESLDRLERLASDWPRIAIGSSEEYREIGTTRWWVRMNSAMKVICDQDGRPIPRVHGLRMLNPKIFTRLPLSSADSTNIARNVGIDKAWNGTYQPPSKEVRAMVMRERIEAHNAPTRFFETTHQTIPTLQDSLL